MDLKKSYLNKYIYNFSQIINSVDIKKLILLAKLINKKRKKNIYIFGNGGSSSIASHFSVDLLKQYNVKTFFQNNANLITCFANDYGHDNWMKKILEFYCNKNDLVILISSSGKSKNILNAARYCLNNKVSLVTLNGFGYQTPLSKYGEINFGVNSRNYNVIENTHQFILLTVIDYITDTKF